MCISMLNEANTNGILTIKLLHFCTQIPEVEIVESSLSILQQAERDDLLLGKQGSQECMEPRF